MVTRTLKHPTALASRNPTISDVARLADVSKSTVSAVLNNKPTIKDSTRREVLRVISELNYRPSRAARRGFRPVTHRGISFVVKEAQNPYYAEELRGIQEVAAEHDYVVFLASSDGRQDLEHAIVEQCVERELDGLIITPIRNDDSDLSHLFELKRNNIPFVLLEQVQGMRANLVDVDNVKASCEAVRYLIGQGHSRIVHFAGPHYSDHSRERIDGIRRAFSESHLRFDETMLIRCGASTEDGYRTGLELFGAPGVVRPTAVTCYNDLVALGLLRALRELGIGVPEDVSVVGFDDIPILDLFDLPLTTVRVPMYEMGRRAAEMLIRQIESRSEVPPEKVFLDAELVIRGTTRAPA